MRFETASAWVMASVMLAACSHSNSDTVERAAVPVDGKVRVLATDDGFAPSLIAVQAGKPLTLEFLRTVDTTCATDAVFPELSISKPLPKGEVVAIEIPTGEARELTFQCGMGMYKSKVVIKSP